MVASSLLFRQWHQCLVLLVAFGLVSWADTCRLAFCKGINWINQDSVNVSLLYTWLYAEHKQVLVTSESGSYMPMQTSGETYYTLLLGCFCPHSLHCLSRSIFKAPSPGLLEAQTCRSLCCFRDYWLGKKWYLPDSCSYGAAALLLLRLHCSEMIVVKFSV